MEDDGRARRAREVVDKLLSEMRSYHDHKETMAHAGIALEVAILGMIMTADKWPPPWLENAEASTRMVCYIGFAVIWLLIHIYVRWQLRNRRWAERQVGGLLRVQAKWSVSNPTMEELRLYFDKVREPCWAKVFVDLILPSYWGSIPPVDERKEGLPEELVDAIQKYKTGPSLFLGELLLWCMSVVAFIIVVCLTFGADGAWNVLRDLFDVGTSKCGIIYLKKGAGQCWREE
jgi:hypothetical protein